MLDKKVENFILSSFDRRVKKLENHLKENKKDIPSKRALKKITSRRKRNIAYFINHSENN